MMTGFAGFVGSGLSGRCEGCGVVLGKVSEVAPVPPWTAVHAEDVGPDSGFSEAVLKRGNTHFFFGSVCVPFSVFFVPRAFRFLFPTFIIFDDRE